MITWLYIFAFLILCFLGYLLFRVGYGYGLVIAKKLMKEDMIKAKGAYMMETMLHVDEFLRKRKVKKHERESFVAVEKQKKFETTQGLEKAIRHARIRGFPPELADYLKRRQTGSENVFIGYNNSKKKKSN